MSTRTIIEINHDYLDRLKDVDFYELVQLLKSTRFIQELNESGYVNACSGIRILAQRHHSDVLNLEVK